MSDNVFLEQLVLDLDRYRVLGNLDQLMAVRCRHELIKQKLEFLLPLISIKVIQKGTHIRVQLILSF